MKQYVFLDYAYDFGHSLMGDLENHPNCKVIYADRLLQGRISKFVHRVLYSKKLNRIFKIPFKLLWLKLLYSQHFNKHTKVIAMSINWYNIEWIDFLKSAYPNAKLVLLLRDTVKRNNVCVKDFNIDKAKQMFDLILSYDKVHDVPVYGLTYAPVYVSVMEDLKSCRHECKYDIVWLAEAKDRMDLVNRLYQEFTAHDLKTFFYICDAEESDKLPGSNIIYGEHYIGRHDSLEKQIDSNCMLEVLKGDAHSCTLRFWEAVIYNKKLYTNWKGVVESPYYDPRFIKVFTNPADIDYDFIKERIEVNYNYQGELSPLKYLEIFEKLIQDKVN